MNRTVLDDLVALLNASLDLLRPYVFRYFKSQDHGYRFFVTREVTPLIQALFVSHATTTHLKSYKEHIAFINIHGPN